MTKRWLLGLAGLNLVLLGFIGFGFWRLSQPAIRPEVPRTAGVAAPTPIPLPPCTPFTHEDLGFSLCYPSAWNPPETEKISPPQQHLYQVVFNPGCHAYTVDLYQLPLPVSLASFVRDYFKNVSPPVVWSHETVVNNQSAVQFFLEKNEGEGQAGVAFNREETVLVIRTPFMVASDQDFKTIVNEPNLTRLTKTFSWKAP